MSCCEEVSSFFPSFCWDSFSGFFFLPFSFSVLPFPHGVLFFRPQSTRWKVDEARQQNPNLKTKSQPRMISSYTRSFFLPRFLSFIFLSYSFFSPLRLLHPPHFHPAFFIIIISSFRSLLTLTSPFSLSPSHFCLCDLFRLGSFFRPSTGRDTSTSFARKILSTSSDRDKRIDADG